MGAALKNGRTTTILTEEDQTEDFDCVKIASGSTEKFIPPKKRKRNG